jgi:hypothetical protein
MTDTRTKTYRKAFTPNALIPKLTRKILTESDRLDYATILDFGCGKDMLIPNKWREEKIWCDGHDLSLPNKKPRLDSYDVIMVSNVLNIQETNKQLEETISEILSLCYDGTQIVWNYPTQPRKLDLGILEVQEILFDLIWQNGLDYKSRAEEKQCFITTIKKD